MAGQFGNADTLDCDVLVIGGGAAALIAALEARKLVDRVVVACKRKPGRSGNTIVAGGGISVCVPSDEIDDSPERHMRDTLEGGDGINDLALVRTLTSEAAEAVLGLEQYGVEFLRSGGSLVRKTPPGHSRPRAISTDVTGHNHVTRGTTITLPLLKVATERGITLLSDTPVHRLLVKDGAVCGALAVDASSGAALLLRSGATVLAAGGGGQLFACTNNTTDVTGDSCALALEAGAALRDMEFVQFFPTQMTSPVRANMPGTLFGAGAVLRNRHGERFMARYDLQGDMATRDVMCRAIFHEVQSGNGVDGGVYMDLSAAVPAPGREKDLGTTFQFLRSQGIDPVTQPVVVSPVTHFVMGGAWIDQRCRTTVPGLFAAGEASGGVHGANRLGGNALTETAVFGRIAGREAAAHVRRHGRLPEVAADFFELPATRPGSVSPLEVKGRLRRALWENASVIRSDVSLHRAETELDRCAEALPLCRVERTLDALACLEVSRMVTVGRCVVASALARQESRGAHFRSDYPERSDSRWLGSTRVEADGEALRIGFVSAA